MNTTTSAPSRTQDTRRIILDAGQGIMARKGYSAVGLNEVLVAADVPKGSFYHYFASKDAFGEALLTTYFEAYLAEMDAILNAPNLPAAQRLMSYLDQWQASQSFRECQGKCLAVKLGAEVADLSEAMRLALKHGTDGIIQRLSNVLREGVEDGAFTISDTPKATAQTLYQLWLGASVMAKIQRSRQPFENAVVATQDILSIRT